MDNHGTWKASQMKSYMAHKDDDRSASDAESSQQGWSSTEWNTNTNSRPSLSSSDDQPVSGPAIITHTPPSQGSEAFVPGIPHRRSTIVKPSLHTTGSNVSLEALNQPLHRSSSAILDIDTPASPSRISSSPLSNGYAQAGPSGLSGASSASASAYASTSYARSRRKETEVEVEAESEEDGDPNSHSAKIRTKKGSRGRGSSFSLPFHRRRKLSTSLSWPMRWWPGGGGSGSSGGIHTYRPKSASSTLRSILVGLLLLGSLLWGLKIWRSKYEIQVEFSVFNKKWIKAEKDTIPKLKGCFAPEHISPEYNLTKHLQPKRNMLNPGISLKRGMSCYDFSSTIQPDPTQELEYLTYHTYWRSNLIPFGSRQLVTLISFLATQPLTHSKLILWTNGKTVLEDNPTLKPFLVKWGEFVQVKQVDMAGLTKNTDLEGILNSGTGTDSQAVATGRIFDEKAWVDGDAIRLLVLWHFGGIWLDMDQILTRDLHPLIEEEWVTQWDCYDKPYFSLNGALMHFEKKSPYLCEAFHLMSSSPFPKPNTFTWGSHLYSKLHRALIAEHIRPFGVLPWCFADPRNCRTDNRFPDPFLADPPTFAGKQWDSDSPSERGREELEERVGQVWSLHLHNQWHKSFPANGWVSRLLEGYEGQLERLEIYAAGNGLVDPDGRIRLG
ncbi:uncharacterized protein I303_103144 [Kwoniella dejecticola CBS 10117]|uniref:Glycosyltransferase family 32 protein n=1 Tax=Kwoniella dejecticola CBS 10117 TaxID=1296121 RepID=A0A1A6AAQ4_9TREE|nr:uncharacterized protein I303_03165 [Kwoniella dejecticola CBS 10117]OBR87141.1 hypothetical protein I303_03165 [Kwoniella dejecticola CBS 10117]